MKWSSSGKPGDVGYGVIKKLISHNHRSIAFPKQPGLGHHFTNGNLQSLQFSGCFMRDKLLAELDQAEKKAWDSLGRYKFQMFGYWAGIWIHLNRISGENRPNPFRQLVKVAREAGHENP
jgi:hypothetical protein